MKKKSIILISIITALAVFAGCATEATGVDDSYFPEVNVPADPVIGNTIPDGYRGFTHDRTLGYDFARLGEHHREAKEMGLLDSDFSIDGFNIIISEQLIAHRVQVYELIGVYNAHDEVFETLAREAMLYAEAVSLGYTASDHEVQELIEAEIELTKTSIFFDEWLSFFDTAHMTVEQHHQNNFEGYRRNLIIYKFLKNRIDTFIAPISASVQGVINFEFFRNDVAYLMDYNHITDNNIEDVVSSEIEDLINYLKQKYEIIIAPL
jgi:hypothetical protein